MNLHQQFLRSLRAEGVKPRVAVSNDSAADEPGAIRAAVAEFISDVRRCPETAVACALIGLFAGLAVTFGLAELLILAGAGR